MSDMAPHIGDGNVADYIPDLARVDPNQFGFIVATVDGQVFSAGDAHILGADSNHARHGGALENFAQTGGFSIF